MGSQERDPAVGEAQVGELSCDAPGTISLKLAIRCFGEAITFKKTIWNNLAKAVGTDARLQCRLFFIVVMLEIALVRQFTLLLTRICFGFFIFSVQWLAAGLNI